MTWLLGTAAGRTVLIVGVVLCVVGAVLLYAYRQGEAAAALAAAAAAGAAAAKANKARAAVRPNDQKDMAHDPHNRDTRP